MSAYSESKKSHSLKRFGKAKQKELYSREVYNSYKPPGGSSHQTCKMNAVMISNQVRFNHEICKAIGGLMIHRYGDVKFTDKMISLVNALEKEILGLGFVKSPAKFISECVPKSESGRRVDLVNLRTGDRFEFENDHKVDKKDCVTIYI